MRHARRRYLVFAGLFLLVSLAGGHRFPGGQPAFAQPNLPMIQGHFIAIWEARGVNDQDFTLVSGVVTQGLEGGSVNDQYVNVSWYFPPQSEYVFVIPLPWVYPFELVITQGSDTARFTVNGVGILNPHSPVERTGTITVRATCVGSTIASISQTTYRDTLLILNFQGIKVENGMATWNEGGQPAPPSLVQFILFPD